MGRYARLALFVFLSLSLQGMADGQPNFGKRKLCNLPFAVLGHSRNAVAGGYLYYLPTSGGAPGPELPASSYYAAIAKYGVYRAVRGRKPYIDWTNPREIADFYEWLSGQENFLFQNRPTSSDPIYRAQAYQTAVYAKLVLAEEAVKLRRDADKKESKETLVKRARALATSPEGSPERLHAVALTTFLGPKDLTPAEVKERAALLRAAAEEQPLTAPVLRSDVPAEVATRIARFHRLIERTGGSSVAAKIYRAIVAETPGTWTAANAERALARYRSLVEPILRREAPIGELVKSLGTLGEMVGLHVARSQSLGRDLPRTAYRSADGTLSVTFQMMPNGIVRVEALRVRRADEVAETFVAEWSPEKKKLEEKKEEKERNCFSCHERLQGRIDFRAQGMRGAAHFGANARTLAKQLARGENVDFGAANPGSEESADVVMKKLKPGSPEAKQLARWLETLGGL